MPTVNEDDVSIEIFSNKPRHSAAAQAHIDERQAMLKQAFDNARAKRLGTQKPGAASEVPPASPPAKKK